MINAIKAHLLDPEYERVSFYSMILGAIVFTVVALFIGSHCGGGVISDGAFRWAS